MNLLQPVKFPPILIIQFQGFLLPFPPACTVHKDHNMVTANKNINENIVAVEDIIPRFIEGLGDPESRLCSRNGTA